MPENPLPDDLADLYVRADRAASHRAIVRGLIHAIRNPLQTLIIATGSARDELGAEVESQPLDLIESETWRLTTAVERLERLYQAESLEVGPTSIRDVVDVVVDMLQYHPPPRRSVRQVMPDGLPPVRCRATELTHAVLNIAMHVERTASDDEDGELWIEATGTPTEVRLSIWGTGANANAPIPDDAFRFDPSANPPPPLAIARHLAERNGGTLDCVMDEQQPGRRLRLVVPTWQDE